MEFCVFCANLEIGVFDFLFVFELHRFLFDIFDKDNDKILLNDDDDVDNDDVDCGRSLLSLELDFVSFLL